MDSEKNRNKRRDKKRTTKMVIHNGGRKLAKIRREKALKNLVKQAERLGLPY
jgi:hypothetical protein